MTECDVQRGILFSGEMVRAILAGTKTQTRRVVTPENSTVLGENAATKHWREWWARCAKWGEAIPTRRTSFDCPPQKGHAALLTVPCTWFDGEDDGAAYRVRSRIEVGDLLWVRETWGQADSRQEDWSFSRGKPDPSLPVLYRADGNLDDAADAYWRPSIFMPRWASRITLRVTDMRVERVESISEADARAEGIVYSDDRNGKHGGWHVPGESMLHNAPSHAFRSLWDSINAARGYGWESSPWVWAVTFERVTP